MFLDAFVSRMCLKVNQAAQALKERKENQVEDIMTPAMEEVESESRERQDLK